MNPSVEAKNRKLLVEYRKKYPHEILVVNMKLSPHIFQKLNPKCQFAFVPLPEGRYWLFQAEDDLNKFKEVINVE